jgi:hypothetical protein
MQLPALRIVVSITSGDESQTQAAIDAGALPHLGRLLNVRLCSLRLVFVY